MAEVEDWYEHRLAQWTSDLRSRQRRFKGETDLGRTTRSCPPFYFDIHSRCLCIPCSPRA